MSKYSYPIYGQPNAFVFIETDGSDGESDYNEMMEKKGYLRKRIGDPFHYVEECSPCVEIVKFTKKNAYTILEIWDHNGSILEMACPSAEAELAVLEKFSIILKTSLALNT